MNNKSSFFVALFFFSIVFIRSAYAQTTPSFPSCLNPQGELIISYQSGIHGVPGDQTTYEGTDAVYRPTADTLIQCLCTINGDGIQSNWWNVHALTSEQTSQLVQAGWIRIPDGSAWGLSAEPYLVKNSRYSCLGGAGGGELSGSVLGLASTGNNTIVILSLSLGILCILLGISLSKRLISMKT